MPTAKEDMLMEEDYEEHCVCEREQKSFNLIPDFIQSYLKLENSFSSKLIWSRLAASNTPPVNWKKKN